MNERRYSAFPAGEPYSPGTWIVKEGDAPSRPSCAWPDGRVVALLYPRGKYDGETLARKLIACLEAK